jgi:hypothetical protein
MKNSFLGLKKSLPAVQTLLTIEAKNPEYLLNSVDRVKEVS